MRVIRSYSYDDNEREPEEYAIMRRLQMAEYEREYQEYIDRYNSHQPFNRERAEFIEDILVKNGKCLTFRLLND